MTVILRVITIGSYSGESNKKNTKPLLAITMNTSLKQKLFRIFQHRCNRTYNDKPRQKSRKSTTPRLL